VRYSSSTHTNKLIAQVLLRQREMSRRSFDAFHVRIRLGIFTRSAPDSHTLDNAVLQGAGHRARNGHLSQSAGAGVLRQELHFFQPRRHLRQIQNRGHLLAVYD